MYGVDYLPQLAYLVWEFTPWRKFMIEFLPWRKFIWNLRQGRGYLPSAFLTVDRS